MKRLFFYLGRYRRESVLAPLFKLLEATLELLIPLIVSAIVDRGVGGGDASFVLTRSLFLILLGVVGLGFSVTAQFFAARAAVGSVAAMKSALFAHIGSLSHRELDALGTPTLITRMTADANQVQNGVNMALRLLLRSPFVVFGAMIMAFTVDARSAVVFAVVIPVLGLVVFAIMLSCLPLYRKVQQKLDTVLSKTRENLTGARVIRAFCKEEEETGEFREANGELFSLQKLVGRISALMGPLTYAIVDIGVIFLLRRGAIRVDSGALSQGDVIALYSYMSQILVELIKLASFIILTTKAVASANRISAVFDVAPSLRSGERTADPSSACAVEFRGVSLRYARNAAESLEDITFSALRGETVGVIGGTGSGKSSLLSLIPRFYDATEGTVLVDGVPVGEQDLAALRRRIGVVPQKAELFSGTVRENLLWGREDASDGEIWRALELAQAKSVVEEKGGLDFVIEPGGRNLSGGQRQRLTVARALVGEPEILLLDDAASALDYATDAALRAALASLSGKTTLFIVSQRAASVMRADKIIVLEQGRVAGIGKSDELYRTCAVYREIYDSQFEKEGA